MRFSNGDLVRVKRGTYTGKEGRVIGPHATVGIPAYLIEGVQESVPEDFLEKVQPEIKFRIITKENELVIKNAFDGITIRVNNDEGQEPHFHFYPDPDDKGVFGCICLGKAKYFAHKEDSKRKNKKLNSHEMKELKKFLAQPWKKPNGMTNWQYMADAWNKQNPTSQVVDTKQEIPKYYSNMPTTKEKTGKEIKDDKS